MLKVRRECLRSPKSILITNCNKLNRFPFHETFAFPIFKNEISNTGHNSVMKNNVKLFSIITRAKMEYFTRSEYLFKYSYKLRITVAF